MNSRSTVAAPVYHLGTLRQALSKIPMEKGTVNTLLESVVSSVAHSIDTMAGLWPGF